MITYYIELAAFAFAWYSFACVAGTAIKEAISAKLEDSQTITLMGVN